MKKASIFLRNVFIRVWSENPLILELSDLSQIWSGKTKRSFCCCFIVKPLPSSDKTFFVPEKETPNLTCFAMRTFYNSCSCSNWYDLQRYSTQKPLTVCSRPERARPDKPAGEPAGCLQAVHRNVSLGQGVFVDRPAAGHSGPLPQRRPDPGSQRPAHGQSGWVRHAGQ